MSTVLSASMATIGVIEGMAEATASITKVVSGVISDYFRKLKGLLVLGYGLGTLSKPMFPLTVNIGWVFMARFFDRMGKGIRGAPRAALVADIMPQEQRGAAYGLRQSLDSVGAFLGPLLAIALMIWFAGDIKSVLWAAVVPAIITISILVLAVKEPSASHLSSAPQKRLGFTHGVDTKLANKTHCR
jgi:sugar phosphate permease